MVGSIHATNQQWGGQLRVCGNEHGGQGSRHGVQIALRILPREILGSGIRFAIKWALVGNYSPPGFLSLNTPNRFYALTFP
jgi:hypothetical protein